jgi:hypothetical protein
MANSFELLLESRINIQKKYEVLSDIVRDYNGKVHGSVSYCNIVENSKTNR